MARLVQFLVLFLFITGSILLAGCVSQQTSPSAQQNARPTPVPAVPDLTNQGSPEAATFTTYPSQTKLHSPDVSVSLRKVAGGFAAPIGVADPKDGSGRLFIVDQTGYVKIFFMNGTVLDQPFMDLRDRMVRLNPAYDERGLLSIAFHPQSASNGRVFVYYSAPLREGVDPNWSCTNRLSEFQVMASDPDRVDMTTEKVLLQVDKPYQNHNGGTLLFGPTDGFLYLPLGDGGRADDTGMGHTPGIGNAQDLTTLLGKVIRIDVDRSDSGKQYTVPKDNPFVQNSSAKPEIYAYGFRNPAYATFDSGGGHKMVIAMAGQRLFESALIVYKGGDFPWNIREGTHCFNPSDDSRPPAGTCPITGSGGQPLIGPVVELGHDTGNTIVGGVVYRGSHMPDLQGSYVFGTWSDESRTVGKGSLFISRPPAGLDPASLPEDAANLTPEQNRMWTTQKVTVASNPDGRVNGFVRGLYEDSNHEVLVLTNQIGGPGMSPQDSGEVWQMLPAGSPVTGTLGVYPQLIGAPAVTMTSTLGTVASAPNRTAAQPVTSRTVPVTLTAKNMAFDMQTITVPAGSAIIMTFVNTDAGIPHNFALYTDSSATTRIFVGQIITGVSTVSYSFAAPPEPGNYFFRCDVHPEIMTGRFVVV